MKSGVKTRTRPVDDQQTAISASFEPGTNLSISAGLAGEQWCLSLVDNTNIADHWDSIEHLATNSVDPNPFYTPDILKPALANFGNGSVKFLCLLRRDQANSDLRFFLPVQTGNWILSGWTHAYGPLGTPLVSNMEPHETLKALAHCLSSLQHQNANALVINHLPRICFVSQSLYASSALSDRLLRFAPFRRGGLGSRDALQSATDRISGKRRQRLASASRKLGKLGTIAFPVSDTSEDILRALADQLRLEKAGWKGRRGTAVLSRDNHLRFMNGAIGNLARKGRCRIHALTLDDTAIASMIMIRHGGHYFPWKIAYDEAYAKYSVGNLLLSHVNETLLSDHDFRALDSLASDLNETANRFWPDGPELANMVIGFGPDAGQTAIRIARSGQRRAQFRLAIKRLLNRFL